MKIQTFIDLRKAQGGRLQPEIEAKRKAVIRDWFKLVLWFIRLRNSAKGKIPVKLLEVEERIQRQRLFNGLSRAKQAKLKDYVKYNGSDGETSSDVDTSDPFEKEKGPNSQADDYSSINEEELMDQEEFGNQL